MRRVFWAMLCASLTALGGCDKVPIVDINAAFSLADAVWFEDEHTLFVFYQVGAEQGIEPQSLIELSYRTDAEAFPWTPLASIHPVHLHVPVDCGSKQRCGSWSLKLEHVPRDVGLRLRYHPQGSVVLPTNAALSVVATGPAYSNRSMVVYGVFDETNTHVQWRARHTFPNLRNEVVEGFGLRRKFRISDATSGDVPMQLSDNPYWYAASECLGTALGNAPLETFDRAIFEPAELSVLLSTHSTVCAQSRVTDGKGSFDAIAVARKNPEVRPAFPVLRSPVRSVNRVNFLLKPCNQTISNQHLVMQEQRLLLTESPAATICLDGWQSSGFAASLSSQFQAAINATRTQGSDMVLTLAFHHDDETGQLAAVLADALARVLIPERDKSTPRAVGAFVFDSYGRMLPRSELLPLVLWCPAINIPDLDVIDSVSERTCALVPDTPDLLLGPFQFSTLPVLPTRLQYLNYIRKYSEAQAGSIKKIDIWAPQLTATSINFPIGDTGVATFFNNEIITPAPSDALSYCPPLDSNQLPVLVFRTPTNGGLLESLPEVHLAAPQPAYALGLVWDSPFRLHVTYETVLGGSLNAFGLSVPFGIRNTATKDFASSIWQVESFDLSAVLKQCTRFCDFPTFDSSGVYQVNAPFRSTYGSRCYLPLFPKLSDGGFPSDP